MHLVDATMFWAGEGGGVRSYLRAKSAYYSGIAGLRHTIVVPGSSTAASPQVPGLPLPFSGGYRFPRSRSAAARVLSALAPDAIEVGDPYQMAWAALDAGQRNAVPVTAFYHSDLTEFVGRIVGAWTKPLLTRYVKHLYREFDCVFVPSRHIQSRLASFGIDRVCLQPLGVNSALFSPVKRDESWRMFHGIPRDATVLLYVGRYAPEKNLDTLVAAAKLLGGKFVLVLIGGGHRPAVNENVMVLPYEGDGGSLATAFASADIFVHAGDQETFGLVALEAMASGLPVVGSARAGIGELIDDTVGAAIATNSAARYAEAIAHVAQSDLAAMGIRARARAQMHDWNIVLPSMYQHYRSLTDRSKSGAHENLRAA